MTPSREQDELLKLCEKVLLECRLSIHVDDEFSRDIASIAEELRTRLSSPSDLEVQGMIDRLRHFDEFEEFDCDLGAVADMLERLAARSSPSVPDGWIEAFKNIRAYAVDGPRDRWPEERLRMIASVCDLVLDASQPPLTPSRSEGPINVMDAHHAGTIVDWKSLASELQAPSHHSTEQVARCLITGHPCGTDTHTENFSCQCANCRAWEASHHSGAVVDNDDEVLFALKMACEHDIHHQAQALRTWLPRIRQWREALHHPSSTGAEEEITKKLAAEGIFKGFHGLEGLSKADKFWENQMYGTRLYYGDGIADYLHRSVLEAAVRLLKSASPP